MHQLERLDAAALQRYLMVSFPDVIMELWLSLSYPYLSEIDTKISRDGNDMVSE